MSKKAKKIIFVVLVVLISAIAAGCGKVHNEISQVRITKISVGNSDAFYDADENTFSNNIDTYRSYCCTSECYESDSGSGSSCKITVEPAWDGEVRFTITNHLNYTIELSHYYYVIKNYYGNGNDYVSPNISFYAGSIVDGNTQASGNTSSNSNEIVTYGAFTDVSGATDSSQKFTGSNVNVASVGMKNVIFYVTAFSQSGQILTFSRALPVVFSNYNYCGDDKIECDGTF